MYTPIQQKLITFFMALLFLATACKNEPKKDPPAVTPPKGITTIKLYLDNSESNLGYITGSTSFKNTVAGLTTILNDRKLAKNIQFGYLSDTIYPQQYTTPQFISTVVDREIKPITLCSEVHHMVNMLASTLDSFDIGILVSDYILSYCDTKGNPNKNRDNAESELKYLVKSAFSELNTKGVCVSIYAFKSDFTGRYFPYKGKGQYYNQTTRPFYIWAIGRKEQLEQFNNQLNKVNDFKPLEQLHFGFGSAALSAFDLFFTTGKKGKCDINKDNISDISIKPDATVEFVMGINLEKLPHYAQKTEYIKKHLQTDYRYLTLKEVKLRSDFELKKENSREKVFKENNTHFLVFEIEDLIKNTDVEIHLENKTDTWYSDWSTMDDLTPESNNEKTFALEHLINGVKEAYEATNAPFYKTTLTLKQ